MKIDYIISESTKGATTAALSKVCKLSNENPFEDYIVIVPETKSIIIEKELLSLSKSGAFANVFVYSFVRLINRLGLVNDENIASKQTAVMLLRKVIYDNFDSLVCYKKTAKTSGFAEKIYETIAQLKSSCISPDELELSLETKNEALKQKLKDIILIYREYEKALGETLLDDCDKLALLSKFASTNETIKNSHIFVVGFDNITFEMQNVLKSFALHAKSITFSCVYFAENRSDKYIQDNELFKKFTHIADTLKYPYTPSFSKKYNSGDFYNIANNLFALPKKQVETQGNVQVFEAETSKQEVEFVVSKILTRVANDGLRFRDFGVLVSNLDDYIADIEKIFTKNKIPYFINKQHDLSSHFFVKFLKNAFVCVNSNFSYENVLAFVSNPIFGADDFSSVFGFVIESGINYKKFLNFETNERYSEITSFENAKPELKKFKTFAEKFGNILKAAKTAGDYIDAVMFVQDYFSCSETLTRLAKLEEDSNLEIESQITSKIFDRVQKYALMFKNFMGEIELSLDEFLLNFFSGIGEIKLNLLPVSIDTVVVQADTDGFFGIKDMFAVGAIEGSFPCSIKDSGIILDSELDETKTLSKKQVEPSVKQINKRENFRIYESLLEPKENLYVSYSNLNRSGSVTKPARIVLRLLGLFGKEKILKKDYEKFSNPSCEALESEFAKSVGQFMQNEITNHEVNLKFGAIDGRVSQEILSYFESENFDSKKFEIKNAKDLYFVDGKTSVSQLEKYFACPYLFFATYGLRLKENKSAKMSSLDIGLIIHRVAELFVKNIDSYSGLKTDEFESSVLKLLKQAIEENNISSDRNTTMLKMLRGEAVRLCGYLLYEHQNSGFKTMKNGTEYSFFGENAIKIPLQNGQTIKIEGKIDRIDSFGDYIRIIDYKTGGVSSELSSVYFGKKVQLVSYLSAVNALTGKKVAGLFYLPIHSDFAKKDVKLQNMFKFEGFLLDDIEVVKNMDYNLSFENPSSNFVALKIKTNKTLVNENRFEISGTSSKNLSEDEFDDVKFYTERLCGQAASEILNGNIEPSPVLAASEETPSMCRWCKFAGFCGKEKAKFGMGRELSGAVSIKSFKLDGGDK